MENIQQKKNNQNKFYEKTWFIILMLLLVCPVGVFLIWKTKKFKKITNIIITVIAVPYTLIGILFWIGVFNAPDTTTETIQTETVDSNQDTDNSNNNDNNNNNNNNTDTTTESQQNDQQANSNSNENTDNSNDSSSDLLAGRTKLEDIHSSDDVINSVTITPNGMSLLGYLIQNQVDYDVYVNNRSTLVAFKYKGKDVDVNIDRQGTFYYYDGKLLNDNDEMMKKLFVEIYGAQAEQDYFGAKKAHNTKSEILNNEYVLIGLTSGDSVTIDSVLNAQTTKNFYDNSYANTVGDLLSISGYKTYTLNLSSIQNLGDGEYYISIGFKNNSDGYDSFGFNVIKDKVYISDYTSVGGLSINENGLYAAKKLGYK